MGGFTIDPNANVIPIGVRPRPDPEVGPYLAQPPTDACRHTSGPFEIDVRAGKCTCRKCGGEVSPMFVLEELMRDESRWMRHRAEYFENMKRLRERSRTKCEHCGVMTRISER